MPTPPTPPTPPNPADSLQKIAAQIEKIESGGDEKSCAQTRDLLHELMEFHAGALEKMLDLIASSTLSGVPLIDQLATNTAITPLLLLYNLHPLALEARVEQALEKARPYLKSHGGDVELLHITDNEIHLKLRGSCHGCPSSAVTLKQTIEQAVNEFAPDAALIHVEEEPTSDPSVKVAGSSNHPLSLPILVTT